MRLIVPGQPRRWVPTDFGAVLLQRHQVFQSIDTRLETGGKHTGEHTGDRSTGLGGIQERSVALPNKEFSGPFHEVVIEGRTGHG